MNNTELSASYKRAFTEEEAANYCGTSASSLQNGRSKSNSTDLTCPLHVKIGRRVVYLREDLDSWLESCRAATVNAGAE